MDLLQQEKIENLIVIAGGTIPREDIPLLKEMGISEVFPPGSSLETIVKYIEDCGA
jgi:methylmalonyl-CoA mutase C-terminal domain/subunit